MSVSGKRTASVVAGVLVLVLGIDAVLAYPAWSAGQGEDVRWTVPNRADALLDHDAGRLLLVRDDTLLVVDRATWEVGATPGHVGPERLAALVPDGVVSSADGRLTVTGPDGVRWETAGALTAVDVEAGLAAGGAAGSRDPYRRLHRSTRDPAGAVEPGRRGHGRRHGRPTCSSHR